jgi:RHS repeat-associated protein
MDNSTSSRRAAKRFGYTLAAFLLLTLAAGGTLAQSTNPASSTTSARTSAGMSPGSPAGTYSLSGFDDVNLFNGNMNFRLPLLAVGGRGSAGYTMTLATSAKKWQVKTDPVLSGLCLPHFDIDLETGAPVEKIFCRQVDNGDSFTPQWKQWNTLQVGYGPGVMQGRKIGVGTVVKKTCDTCPVICNRVSPMYRYTLTRLTFITPDGTEYELRDEATGGKPVPVEQARCNDASNTGANRGRHFLSADGSAVTFVSDVDIDDEVRVSTSSLGSWVFNPSGVLYMRDGTSYRIDNGVVSLIRDRNGNQVTFYYGTTTVITDSLGRKVTVEYGLTEEPYGKHDKITYYGFGGAERVIRVSKSRLSGVLRAPYTSRSTAQLFPELNGAVYMTSPFDPEVVSAVWLPDNRKYRIFYNSYAEVARVELTTGGATEYDMKDGSGVVESPGATGSGIVEKQIYRRLKESRVYTGLTADTLVSRMVYTAGDGTNEYNGTTVLDDHVVTVEQVDAASHRLALSRHYFAGSAAESLFTREEGSLYSPVGEGRETTTVSLDTTDTNKALRTVTNTWEEREPVGWIGHLEGWGSNYPPPGLATEPDNDPRLTRVTTTLDDGEVTKQEFAYDAYNNQTEVKEYAYGQGQAGALLRRSVTQYLTVNPINGLDYAGAASGIHIRNLPSSTEVWDGATSTLVSRGEFIYDEPSRISDDYGTLPPDFPGWTASSTLARGNPTTLRAWLDTLGVPQDPQAYLETHAGYDRFGNAVKAWDARGNASEVKFSADYKYALPTQTISADPDGAEPLSPLTTSTVYDFPSGVVTDTYDANNRHTHVDYETGPGKLDRLKRVTRPDGGWTKYEYGDDIGNLYLRTRTLREVLPVEKALEGYEFFDGVGRAVRSTTRTGENSWAASATEYDGMGRVVRVTNPYEASDYTGAVPQGALWTTTEYDALGRAWQVTTPDGAKVVTHFDGLRTLVTDQAGKQRLSKADALGRLTDVWEVMFADEATGTEGVSFPHYTDVPDIAAGYRTSYTYDVLGDLRKVEQGAQRRYFAYDSLKRLLRVKNPEQEALGALQLPAGMLSPLLDNNNGWSLKYEYDGNGNLSKRTDALGILTEYVYDTLNRVTLRSYSDSTPIVTYTYGNDPAANSKGRLISVSSSVSTYSYTAFDVMGRVTACSQTTGGVTYSMPEYKYDLAGNLTSETYPSGRVVETQYDAGGRLAGVKNHGGAYYAGGDPGVANNPNLIAYAAHGGVTALRLGNGLWEHTLYNERLQPYEIGLGTSSAESSKLKLEYGYAPTVGGTIDPTKNNGNVHSQRISVPAEGAAPAQTFAQSYTYDTLNRLESTSEVKGVSETWRQTYSYDRFGNRRLDEPHTTKINGAGATVYVVDSSNRPTMNPTISTSTNRITEAGYSFDAAGNLLCDSQHPCDTAPSPTPYFVYDAENRMVRTAGGAQAGGSEYVYDGDGKRVKKTSGSEVTVFVYNAAGMLVAEYGGAQSQTGGVSYLTQDTLGSTRMVSGQNGEVKSRHDYLPFGEEINGINLPNSGREGFTGYNYGTVRQKFTGYEKDDETGLNYAKARYYAGNAGRFTSPDPLLASEKLGAPQSWNRYAYVLNSPLSLVDPDGLQDQGAPSTRHAQLDSLPAPSFGSEPKVTYGPFVDDGPSKNEDYWNTVIGFQITRFALDMGAKAVAAGEVTAEATACEAALPVIAVAGGGFILYGTGERIGNPVPPSPYMTLADGTKAISCTAGNQALSQLKEKRHLFSKLSE